MDRGRQNLDWLEGGESVGRKRLTQKQAHAHVLREARDAGTLKREAQIRTGAYNLSSLPITLQTRPAAQS